MLNSVLSETLTLPSLGLCLLTALVLGIGAALVYTYRNPGSRGFVITLALLPTLIGAIILMVNGNLGTGVAVMGAFSLVRFRSVPGGAREIGAIVFAMALGLAAGTGYLGAAVIFFLVVGGMTLLLVRTGFGQESLNQRELRITIPEDLDYTTALEDVFATHTTAHTLTRVKTTGLGSLFELRYQIELRHPEEEKTFLDALRCRNGNLSIQCGRRAEHTDAL